MRHWCLWIGIDSLFQKNRDHPLKNETVKPRDEFEDTAFEPCSEMSYLTRFMESRLSTSLWNRHHQRFVKIELDQISTSEKPASQSGINPCLPRGSKPGLEVVTQLAHTGKNDHFQICSLKSNVLGCRARLNHLTIFTRIAQTRQITKLLSILTHWTRRSWFRLTEVNAKRRLGWLLHHPSTSRWRTGSRPSTTL
jgi:hypothetical protein